MRALLCLGESWALVLVSVNPRRPGPVVRAGQTPTLHERARDLAIDYLKLYAKQLRTGTLEQGIERANREPSQGRSSTCMNVWLVGIATS